VQSNDLAAYEVLLRKVRPFSGRVPKGFLVDFLGMLTDVNICLPWQTTGVPVDGGEITARCPDITWGEYFFEAVDWFEAVREARGSYTMITLGANSSAQAIDAYLALQQLNPMKAKLVGVEAEPQDFARMRKNSVTTASIRTSPG
jgi:hypothetical protein